jgi:hypothetical protein
LGITRESFAELGDLIAYDGRPIGDTPEFMCWDCSLNKDLHDSINWHILLTSDLADDNPKKFSISTPKRGSLAHFRVLHPETGGVPSSERIMGDVYKIKDSMLAVYKNDGAHVALLQS